MVAKECANDIPRRYEVGLVSGSHEDSGGDHVFNASPSFFQGNEHVFDCLLGLCRVVTDTSYRTVLHQWARAGHWANAAAGHVESNESAIGAAAREAYKELGIVVSSADLRPLVVMHRNQKGADEVSVAGLDGGFPLEEPRPPG